MEQKLPAVQGPLDGGVRPLVERLRAMARAEHDDLSIGDEAADELEQLHEQLACVCQALPEPLRNSVLSGQSVLSVAVSTVTAGAELADSEGTRAVEYLRRARKAEADLEALRSEANKSERRAIVFGDIVHSQVVAMQAAVLEGHLKTAAHGLQWIVNTLAGPGHLPDPEEARALGGAQAWFDRETAKHEAFRAAHPGPAA